jgi:hypothetical protein
MGSYAKLAKFASTCSLASEMKGNKSTQNYILSTHCDFSSPRRPDRLWGSTHPPGQWVPGVLSPRVLRPGREADHSRLSNAEVKNFGTILPLPKCLHGTVLN